MSENPVALVTTEGHATVIVRLPAALATDESVAVSESELRHVIQKGVEAAGPDSRMEIAIDGPEMIGVIEIQGPVDGNKRLHRPEQDQRQGVVRVVSQQLQQLGYDVNPNSAQALKGEDTVTRMNNFLDSVLGPGGI